MRPLCGGMTRNLDQGPVTGVLRELGNTQHYYIPIILCFMLFLTTVLQYGTVVIQTF